MKNDTQRQNNIIHRATKLSGQVFDNWESAEEWLYNSNIVDERHECDVKSLGNHGQRVDFGNFWSQGEIVDFSLHWHDDPETEVDHEKFIDDDGKVIQLFYKVGETQHNVPDGYYYDYKQKCHLAMAED